MFDLKIHVGHCDLYFMGQWFCLISWRLFDIWTLYFVIMSQFDPMFDIKINVGHCDLYFMVQWFLPYVVKAIWCVNTIIWDYESVWPEVSFFNVCSEKHFKFYWHSRIQASYAVLGQLLLWRYNQNYPLIITKYAPYLFHWNLLCLSRPSKHLGS